MLNEPERLLATILIANNFINIAIVVLSTYMTSLLFDFSNNPALGFFIQVIVITLIILFLGEIMPKIYSADHAIKFSSFMAVPMMLFMTLFKPLSAILLLPGTFINKKFYTKRKKISMEYLSTALELTSYEIKEDKHILKGIVEFGNIEVKEIMCARTNILSVEWHNEFTSLIPIIIESGYSRIPVYEETLDNIKGILFIKDLLPYISENQNYNWQHLLKPAYFVPEAKRINDLLSEFQKNKIHMAVVVDEYGGTSGLVTMEDILEEIVGDISDESDAEQPAFLKISENIYIFEGKTLLLDFCKITSTDEEVFKDAEGDAETLAGLILELKGEIPQKNDSISFKHFTFIIESADKRRIKQVKVIINEK